MATHPLLDRFEANVDARGEALAVADAGLALSYPALRAVAGGLAGQIERAASRPRVGIMAPTSAAGATAILACWYAGRTPVPLNFLLSDAELAAIGRDADLDRVVTVEPLADKARATGAEPLVLSGSQNLVPRPRPAPAAAASDTGVILYTSGTTGAPKGVCLSFQNLVSNADACIAHARMDPDRVFLSVLPQFHSFGFTAMTVVPLLLGATAWYLPRFSPVAVLNCIAQHRVNVFMAVASMYAALLRQRETPPLGLASLQLAVSGGEPLPAAVAAAFRERFGIELMEGYGLTETSPVVSLNVPWAHRPGSVGRALPGVDVRAVDDAGAALPAGREGELVVRGHCVMHGYHSRPEETATVVRGGALHTGDIGRVDADGYVHITGRARELMIVGGENVFPAEIEAVLLEHPAVADAGVVGAPDALRGESPVAFVMLREGAAADPAELRRFCRDRLAGYKSPREVRIVPDLPRGPTGKVLRRALRGRL